MSFFDELKRRNVFRIAVAYGVVAWLALQVADVMIDNIGAPDWLFRTLLLVLVIGFPITLVLAWAFELTPEGIKRDDEVDRETSIAPRAGRRLDRVIIALLVIVVGWFLVDEFYLEPRSTEHARVAQQHDSAPASPMSPSPATTNSLAVLPFQSMSSGPDDEYFADGLTEEILNALAQIPELLVTARTSSFHFKGRNLPIPEIAAQLGVEHVVEGSVRRSGERVRITAQLIRAVDGFHLWSNTYDRTLEDVFAVQEDIARNIVETLDIVLDEEKLAVMRRSGIGDINTFITFQKGRELFVAAHDSNNPAGMESSIAAVTPYFEDTVAVAPGLVAAWLYLVDVPAHAVINTASGQREERFPGEAEQHLETIRGVLDQAWEQARAGQQRDILDVERTLFRDDWTGLAEKFDRALRPGECPRDNWMSEFATTLVSPEAMLRQDEAKVRCDPLNGLVVFNHAYNTLWTGNPEETLRLVDEARQRDIEFGWLDGLEFMAHLTLGNFDHPSMTSSEPIGWYPYDRETLRAAAQGPASRARELVELEFQKDASDDWTSLVLAAMIGDRKLANQLAARIDARPGGFLALNNAAYSCLCGSPFDLEATPNFARRLAEAGIIWSPRMVIQFPGKDW